tara:strand:+ start:721 stop:951 length:231 start_codon:yes stop_codon:yes gene_type:complete
MITAAVITKVLAMAKPHLEKLLLSKIKPLQKYVFEKNDLDIQMEGLTARVKSLEKMAHPVRDFVQCNQCKKKIKEK